MVKKYIELGHDGWAIILCYNIEVSDSVEMRNLLKALGCPERDIKKSIRIIIHSVNSALTFSNTDLKMSIVCIGNASSNELIINSIVHEAKHVLSHICEYYGVNEDSELAAYLIGYIVLRMYRALILGK